MATFTKDKLSGSTNGKAIKISGTATGSANTIHTAVSGTSSWDEVWIYAQNTSAATVKLTIEWGETTAPDGNIEVGVTGESGLLLVIPGLLIQNGLLVKAFAGTTNVITLHGYIHRIA